MPIRQERQIKRPKGKQGLFICLSVRWHIGMCSVLQCVAVCCSVLQCGAVYSLLICLSVRWHIGMSECLNIRYWHVLMTLAFLNVWILDMSPDRKTDSKTLFPQHPPILVGPLQIIFSPFKTPQTRKQYRHLSINWEMSPDSGTFFSEDPSFSETFCVTFWSTQKRRQDRFGRAWEMSTYPRHGATSR